MSLYRFFRSVLPKQIQAAQRFKISEYFAGVLGGVVELF